MALRFDNDFLKKLEYLRVVSKRAFAGQNRADRLTPKRGRGIEFADHRPYAPGDDFRHIDWKAYKRLGRLLLRLFDEERDLPIYLMLDCSRSMAGSTKFDLARRLAAALCYIGLVHLDRITILPFGRGLGDESSPGRGKGRIFRVFELLERLEAAGPTDLRESFKEFASRPRPMGMTVILSDFLDPGGFEAGLKILRTIGHDVVVIHVVSERDVELGGASARCASWTRRPATCARWTSRRGSLRPTGRRGRLTPPSWSSSAGATTSPTCAPKPSGRSRKSS